MKKTGRKTLNVEIKISNNITDPYAVIYTDKISDEIQKAIETLENQSNSVIPLKNKNEIFLNPVEEIVMIQLKNNKIIAYDKNNNYTSNKRLYGLEKTLGKNFYRISKPTIINIKEIDKIVLLVKGTIHIKMKNGLEATISRKYLPKFKKHLRL